MASNWCDTSTVQWIGFISNKYRKECMTRVEWLEFLHPNPMLQLDLLPFCQLVMHKPHDILLSSMARPPFHFPANSFYSRRLVPFFTDCGNFYFLLQLSGNAGAFSSALNVGPLSLISTPRAVKRAMKVEFLKHITYLHPLRDVQIAAGARPSAHSSRNF